MYKYKNQQVEQALADASALFGARVGSTADVEVEGLGPGAAEG
jgi:hypothetical protein